MQDGVEVVCEEVNDFEVVYDEEFDPERERQLEERMAQETGGLSSYWANNFTKNAGKYWHDFYRHNGNRFFKDRHYLDIVFSELNDLESKGNNNVSLLEVGCGVGNAFFPLCGKYPSLHIFACDFAKSAIEIIHVRNSDLYDSNRMHVWQADLVKDEIVEHVPEEGCDLLLIMFVLSAVNPQNMDLFMDHALKGLKKGGVLMFRDYGRYDMAQVRFKSTRKIEPNLYARQDGTLAYFFDIDELDELFTRHGLERVESKYIRRCIRNRKSNKEMHQKGDCHFVCFQKTESEMQPSYQWMLSPEVLKKTNNPQDSSRTSLSEQLPYNYSQTNQYMNPAVGISYQNPIVSNTNIESVTTHEGDSAEKNSIQETEITPSTENPVESNQPVAIKEENDVSKVKEEHDDKESAESVELKVVVEPPTQSEALDVPTSLKKEESITVEKVERKRSAHFIYCSEEKTEDPYRYINPENGEKWIRCQNPFCGKWRFVPEDIEMPEKNPWFCILNTWDEEVASCSYPQLQEGCIITKKKEEPEKLWLPKRECHFEKLTAASY